jgi:hypothetical protein
MEVETGVEVELLGLVVVKPLAFDFVFFFPALPPNNASRFEAALFL